MSDHSDLATSKTSHTGTDALGGRLEALDLVTDEPGDIDANSQVATRQSVPSALTQVPEEIIAQVLIASTFSISDPALRLSEVNRSRLVCSQWNDIILGHPTFRNDITLLIPIEHQWRASITRATEWLQELGENLKVRVNIVLEHSELQSIWHPVISRERIIPEVVQFLVKFSNHLSAQYVEQGNWDTALKNLKLLAYETPSILRSVRSFAFVGQDGCDIEYDNYQITFLPENVPHLKQLILGSPGPGDGDTLYNYVFPWAQLTSLSLAGFANRYDVYLYVLRQCKRLEHLSIHCFQMTEYFSLVPQPYEELPLIPLPNLKSLHFHNTYDGLIFWAVLDRLVIPNLKEFCYHDDAILRFTDASAPDIWGDLLERLSRTLKQSSASLGRLEINMLKRFETVGNSAIARFLRTSPSIQDIAITSPCMDCGFLASHDELPPFHDLRSLRITCLVPSLDAEAKHNFAKWLERRCASAATEDGEGTGGRGLGKLRAELKFEDRDAAFLRLMLTNAARPGERLSVYWPQRH